MVSIWNAYSRFFRQVESYTMSLTEAQFHGLVDDVQSVVEDAFDDSDLDVDLENSGGVLTIRFENKSQLILSRQPALSQLWVAARSGGFHFNYDQAQSIWTCQGTGESLGALLQRATAEQGGCELAFPEL
jgi:CyaY protein